MTCIAAWVEGGKITMGADSAGVNADQDLQLRKDTKVFKRWGVLFGVAGSWRACQEVMYKHMPVPSVGQGKHEWLVREFLPWLRANVHPEALEKTEILVGLQGSLYHVYRGEQVSEELAQYEAAGCGAQIARGAFFAMIHVGYKINPGARVVAALLAAERHSAGVHGPFTVMETE